MEIKHSNYSYTSGITTNNLDRRYGGDFVRDFYHEKEYNTQIINALFNTSSNTILSGGICTQGTGHTLSITPCQGLVKFAVTVPDSWGVIPPSTTTKDIYMMVESTQQTSIAIPSAVTDGSTINYIKLQYVETPTSTRTKAEDPTLSTYSSEIIPSFELVVNSTANSSYDLLLNAFTTNGTTISFLGTSATRQSIIDLPDMKTGWISTNETWTYASADSPTFTFTISGDKTGKYSVGMKLRLTQTTTKYFIITAISYSSPNTTITVYGGTDYTLANATITNPYYSVHKSPYGFPMSPLKWSITLSSTSARSTSSPTVNTYYNAESIILHIGVWEIAFSGCAQKGAANTGIRITLSTSSSGESSSSLSLVFLDNASTTAVVSFEKNVTLSLTSKTVYYLNYSTEQSGSSYIGIQGNYVPTLITAVCAYL